MDRKVGNSGFLDDFRHVTDVWSPNYYANTYPNSGITVHHMATTNFDSAGARFVQSSQQASAHYGVGDGYFCQYVSEEDGAWHAGNNWANTNTIGIETVNSYAGGDWPVSDEAFETLAHLMADIAYRHGWSHLEHGVNVWGHREFQATACPGEYLYGRLDELCARANDILENGDDMKLDDMVLNDGRMIMGGTTNTSVRNVLYWTEQNTEKILTQITALTAAVEALATANGADPQAIMSVVEKAVNNAVSRIVVSVDDRR